MINSQSEVLDGSQMKLLNWSRETCRDAHVAITGTINSLVAFSVRLEREIDEAGNDPNNATLRVL